MVNSPSHVPLAVAAALGAVGSAAIMISAILPPTWAVPLVITGAATAALTYLYLALRLLRDVRRPASDPVPRWELQQPGHRDSPRDVDRRIG
jgi:hypothetical protein